MITYEIVHVQKYMFVYKRRRRDKVLPYSEIPMNKCGWNDGTENLHLANTVVVDVEVMGEKMRQIPDVCTVLKYLTHKILVN